LVHRLFRGAKASEVITMFASHLVLALIGTYFVGAKFYFLYWLLPYLTFFQAITWFIELAEHYPIVADAKSNLHATRNRFGHPVEHFFTGMHGENFHLIHHLFPSVPFWMLKRAHRTLLQDAEYARINATFGGIFYSSNFAHSMWFTLLKEPGCELIEDVTT
jgi:fatty acid desaturase